jgi:hypothetical protein
MSCSNDLSAMPPLIHCRKCGAELLHANATFFTVAGKECTVPVPHCSQCDPNEEMTEIIPAASTQ